MALAGAIATFALLSRKVRKCEIAQYKFGIDEYRPFQRLLGFVSPGFYLRDFAGRPFRLGGQGVLS